MLVLVDRIDGCARGLALLLPSLALICLVRSELDDGDEVTKLRLHRRSRWCRSGHGTYLGDHRYLACVDSGQVQSRMNI